MKFLFKYSGILFSKQIWPLQTRADDYQSNIVKSSLLSTLVGGTPRG